MLKTERRRQPVLKGSARSAVPHKLKTGSVQMPGISFKDVRIHYSPSGTAGKGAWAYAPGPSIDIGLGQERPLSGGSAHATQRKQRSMLGGVPVQMCPRPGGARLADESEDELDSFCSESDTEDNFNVASVSLHRRKSTRHVSNKAGRTVPAAYPRKKLIDDAKAIHDVLGNRKFSGNTTVVCAVLKVKNGFLHIAMINKALMCPAMRVKAAELKYTVIRGIQTHAEANLILYAHKHEEDARIIALGCDKDTCPQCAQLLREFLPAGLKFPERPLKADGKEKYSDTYHFESTSAKPKGIGPFVTEMESVIGQNYDEKGKLKKGAPI